MLNVVSDLRHGLRILLRNPGFAATAVLLLALGIGANTAIFSVVNAVLLRPLPYQDSSRIMQIWHVPPAKSFPGLTLFSVSPANYLDWQSQNHSFDAMAAYGGARLNVGGKGRPEAILAAPVAPDFFSILRVRPVLGRSFTPDDDRPGQGHVVILGNTLWRDHFASDPGIVGRNIILDGESYNVVGVMPPNFRFPWSSQVWIPQLMDSKGLGRRGSHWANAIGRMKPGVTLKAAQADLKLIASRLEKQYPDSNDKVGAAVTSLREDMVGDSRGSLFMMLTAVGLVLLIACANVANLLLSRAMARQKEVAIRSALGASRVRLLRQLLTESLLLSLVGGGFGLLLAWGGVALFSRAESYSLPQFNTVQLNGTVLAFTLVLAIATSVLFGVFPALQTSRSDMHGELKGGAGSSISSRSRPGSRTRSA